MISKSESVFKGLLKVSIPAAISMFVAASFGIIDEILSIQFGTGTHQLLLDQNFNLTDEGIRGIIQALMPLYLIISAITFAGSTALSNSFGLAIAKNEEGRATKTLGNVITFHFVLWIGFVILGFSFMNILLKLQLGNVDGRIIMIAKYMAWLIIFTAFFQFFSNILIVVLKIKGYNISTSLIPTIAFAVNIILDLLFLITFKSGLFGTAIATSIAFLVQFLMSIGLIIYCKSKYIRNVLLFSNLKIDHNLFWNVFLFGLSSLIRNVLLGVSFFIFNIILASLELQTNNNLYWISLFSIASSYIFLGMGYISGFVQGANIFIIQNIGKRSSKRVRLAGKWSVIVIILSLLIIEAFLLGFSPYFVSIFLHNKDHTTYAQTLSDGEFTLIYSLVLLPLFGLGTLISSFYESIYRYLKSIFTISFRYLIFLFISLFFLIFIDRFYNSWFGYPLVIFLGFPLTDLIFSLIYIIPFYNDVSRFQIANLIDIFQQIEADEDVDVTKSIVFQKGKNNSLTKF